MSALTALRTRAGGAAQLLGFLAGLATPPLLLATVVGNPLPGWPIDWADVAARLQSGLVPPSVWVDLLAVVAWAAWAVLAVMLAVEVVAVVRDRPSRTGVPVWVRRLAQVLISAAVTLAGPAQPTASAAAGEQIMVAAATPASDSAPPADRPATEVEEGRLVTVGEGDSWAGFAADVVGDSSLGQALRDANLGRQVGGRVEITEATAFVEPGWQLLIPTELDPQPDPTPTPSPSSGATSEPVEDAADTGDGQGREQEGTVEVESGDHFWKIAEHTLAEVWNRTPSDGEVAGYWTDLVDANRDRLRPPGDSDLIYPGQEFVTPPVPADPTTAEGDAEVEPTHDTDTNLDDEPSTAPFTPADQADQSRPGEASSPGTGTTSRWKAAVIGSGAPRAEDQAVDEPGEDQPRTTAWGVPVGLPGGLAASGILAAGVTAMVRRRRRLLMARRQVGMRLPTPAPEAVQELGRLDGVAPPGEVLDDLISLLCSIPEDVAPAVVTTADDGTVELLFDDDTPVPDPVAPWDQLDHDDNPVGWQATIGDRGPARSYGLPLLVTAGQADGRTVLVNLSAIGCLAVTGDDVFVGRLLHRATMEVAASPVSGPVEVAVAGDDRLADWYRVHQVADGQIVVDKVAAEQGEVSIHDRMPQLIVCHPGTDAPALPDGRDGMVGVIAAVDDTAAHRWDLAVDTDDTGRLHLPDGATVDLTLPEADIDVLEHEVGTLDHAAAEPPRTDADQPYDATAANGTDKPDPHANSTPHDPVAEPAGTVVELPNRRDDPPWCDVQILGPVRVLIDGKVAEQIRGLPLEVLTYLVTHPDGTTPERLDTDVWDMAAGKHSQRAKAALIRLRKLLGDGPDGEPLLPNRSPGQRQIVLSKHVGTDADRALAHVDNAQHLPDRQRLQHLTAAVDLVRGEPFQDLPMSWTTDHTQRLVARLQDAAMEVATAHREAGEYDAAENTIQRGISLCQYTDGPYVEWARIEIARGHPEQVPVIRGRLRRLLREGDDDLPASLSSDEKFEALIASP